MFWILMSLVLLVATLLQAHLPGIVFFGGARWPVLGSVVLYYALNHRRAAGLTAGLVAGLLLDMLSLVPAGYSVLLFCVMAMVAGRYRRLVLPEASVTAAFFGGLSGLLYASLLYGVLAHGTLQGCPPVLALARLVGGAVTGALAAPVVFLVMSALHRALDLDDKEEQNRVNA
jgi:rod shape-determining protein MreD